MEEIKRQLAGIIKDLYGVEILVEVTVAPEGQRSASGRKVDYATNVAMRLAGQLKRKPQEIAGEIKEKFLELYGGEAEDFGGDFEVEVAGPGFLNFISSDEYFKRNLWRLSEHFEENIVCDEYRGKMVISEFSDPNPFKVLHVGHLYTSIMGEAISKLVEFAGGEVKRANFGGDVGLHVAKTLYAVVNRLSDPDASDRSGQDSDGCGNTTPTIRRAPASLTADAVKSLLSDHLDDSPAADIAEFLAECYVEGTRAYENDEEAHREIVALNKILYKIAEESHPRRRVDIASLHGDIALSLGSDPRNAPSDDLLDVISALYWWGREASYKYFEEFYASIGLRFDKYYPESTVAKRGLSVVKEQLEKGVYELSDGAVVFRGEPYGLHTRVFINKEGLPTYEAKDVGLIHTKWDDYHFDKSIVITGNDIIDYMKVVLKSVEQYNPELVERTEHVTHGNVKLKGGVKMSSRKGNFLKAVDVLEMVREALEKVQGEKETREEGDLEGNGGDSEKIALGATKYAFLKYKIGGDIIFSPEESVSMTGNSGPYLQYACVRAEKILTSVGEVNISSAGRVGSARRHGRAALSLALPGSAMSTEESLPQPTEVWILSEQERELIKKVMEYGGVLREAVEELAPHKICAYLYELAQVFNRFYEKVKVVGSEHEAERATIVSVYLAILTHGLSILGIDIPEKM